MHPCLDWRRPKLEATLRKLILSTNPFPKWALGYTFKVPNVACS